MARISTYTIDTLDANDKLHGTDQNGITRNFQVGPSTGGGGGTTIVNYISECDTRALAWQWHNSAYNGNSSPQPGSIVGDTGSVTKTFSSTTEIKVSKFPFATAAASGANMTAENILAEYNGHRVMFHDINDPNIYGIFDVTNIATTSGQPDFKTLTVSHVSSNGTWKANPSGGNPMVPDVYVLEIWVDRSTGDKHHEHAQENTSATWNITHNLNKFPAVQIKNSSGVEVMAAVTHTNKNSLTITFSSPTSGTAFLN